MLCVFNKSLYIKAKRWTRQGEIFDAVQKLEKTPICPYCQSELTYKHGYYFSSPTIKGDDGSVRRLRLKRNRHKCRNCGRTFTGKMPGLAAWERRNDKLNKQIADDFYDSLSIKIISKRYRYAESGMMRSINKSYTSLINQNNNYPCPRVLGIDEHSIHKGRKYAITLVDLRNHRVYDVIEGRSLAKVETRIRQYKGRDGVKVVCMDLSPTMRSIAQRLFAQAKIVTDRFHVVKLVIESLLNFAREAYPEIRWKRGIMQVLRKHQSNLTTQQRRQLTHILETYPNLEAAYEFKEKLCKLINMKQQNKKQCRYHIRALNEMLEQLKQAPAAFAILAKTISKWYEPIIRMWRFTKNNGITEGFHRKMKLIQRRAYGFRNFENYRLRVLVECGGYKR